LRKLEQLAFSNKQQPQRKEDRGAKNEREKAVTWREEEEHFTSKLGIHLDILATNNRIQAGEMAVQSAEHLPGVNKAGGRPSACITAGVMTAYKKERESMSLLSEKKKGRKPARRKGGKPQYNRSDGQGTDKLVQGRRHQRFSGM